MCDMRPPVVTGHHRTTRSGETPTAQKSNRRGMRGRSSRQQSKQKYAKNARGVPRTSYASTNVTANSTKAQGNPRCPESTRRSKDLTDGQQ
ncbi:hypothetical protein NDU88_005503 [Pleurodeles waltl]|uniref:Uncharacterized protein n=1 Tax=Pleurodeles waltl TaxID=8319 RepID=A0AAV7LMY7_PLEWA|nr:hypothetical protein NDU88_005503 [Pleurodeles waltl]